MKTKAAQEISVLQKICNVMRLSEANLTLVMSEMSSLSVEIIEDLAEQLSTSQRVEFIFNSRNQKKTKKKNTKCRKFQMQ